MLNFETMGLDQLLKLVDNNFYQKVTTEEQFIDFIINIYHKACLENGMSTNPSTVVVTKLQKKDYAVFNHLKNKLFINKCPIDFFEECKKQNNLFLPFLMIETAVHEARHFSQFNLNSKVDSYLKDYAQFALFFPAATTDMHYNTDPLEVDAKHYTYSLLEKYPFLNKYQSHRDFYNSEYKNASGYSSIYTALLKANSIMHQIGQVTADQQRVFASLDASCSAFLQEHGIDITEFCKALLQLRIRKDEVDRLTNRPTENKLIEKTSEALKQELLKKIFTDKVLTCDDLLKCKQTIFSLNTRVPIKELAFYEIKFDAFRAQETRALYRHYAPKFLSFGVKAKTALPAPQEELTFKSEYNGSLTNS